MRGERMGGRRSTCFAIFGGMLFKEASGIWRGGRSCKRCVFVFYQYQYQQSMMPKNSTLCLLAG